MWKVPRIWPGADVVIIGGGPSFKSVDRSVLKDLSQCGKIRVIGINKAYKEIPDSGEWIHVLWFGDDVFYKIFSRMKEGNIYTFPGIRVGCCPSAERDKACKFVGRDHRHGLGISEDPRRVCWNKNSGCSAINLAYHLAGPGSRIFLFGFDMARGKEGQGHWHGGYHEKHGASKAQVEMPFHRWLGTFPSIARDAKRLRLQILNVASPNSAIQEFPKIDFLEAVRMIEEKHVTPQDEGVKQNAEI